MVSTCHVPDAARGTRNSVVNDTKSLSLWHEHFALAGQKLTHTHTHYVLSPCTMSRGTKFHKKKIKVRREAGVYRAESRATTQG